MKSGLISFKARSGQNKRMAAVFIVLSGLLITICVAYGLNGQRRVQGPRTSTQQPAKRGRAIRAKTQAGRKNVDACFPPPSGLVSWYQSEANANDFTNANAGTANANVTFVPGKVGQAFNFDGSGTVDINDSASLRPSALTIDGWIRPNFVGRPRFTADFDTIFEKMDANHDGYILGVTQDPTFTFGASGPFPNGTIAFQVNIAGGIQAVYSTATIPNDTQFHHVAGTYDGAFLRVYLDGNLVGQKTVGNTIVHSTGTAHIGLSTASGVKNALAAIDEVDIYNRALTDAEVGSIFFAGGDGKCTTPQTPLYFENFETAGNAGYTSNNSAGAFGWTKVTNCGATLPGHSLVNVFKFGNPAACNDYGIGVRTAATLNSVPIDLTNASGTLVLDFRYLLKTDSASISANTDVARVDLFEMSGGPTFIRTVASNRQLAGPLPLLQDAGPAGSPVWNDLQVDVSDFAHKQLVVSFSFDTVDGTNNNLDGWMVDDVQIRTDSGSNGGGTEILHVNFERGLSGFVSSPNDQLVGWRTTTDCEGMAGGHSQPTVVRAGTLGACDYDSGITSDSSLTSPNIDLTGVSGQIVMAFNYSLSTESTATDLNADIATVRVSTNNFVTSQVIASNRPDLFSDAQLLFDAGDTALPRNLMRSVIDLSDFGDFNIKVRFEFNTVDALQNAFPGWALDDIQVRINVNAPTPVIFGVDPNIGTPGGGETVTLTGFGFTASGNPSPPQVFFGSQKASNVVVADTNTITATVPPGTAGSTVKVSVVTANGQTREDVFYLYAPPPHVDSISPNFGQNQGGTNVTIKGTNFDPIPPGGHFIPASGASVMFGPNPGTNVVVVDDNTITVDTPAGTGSVDVIVTTFGGSSNPGVKFTYFPVIVTSISPNAGPQAGGTNFTLTGFGDPTVQTTGVTIGGKPATNVVVSPNSITGTTPSGVGQVPVVVQTNQGPSNDNILFTYQPTPLANQVTAVMTTYLAGDLGIVLPNPDQGLPNPSQIAIVGIPPGAHPYGAAFATSDHLLISDFGNSRVFVVRVSDHSVLSTIDTSPDYDGRGTIAVSPNRTFALFASGPTLYVKSAPIDAAGPHTTVTLPGNVEDFRKQAIAFDINGRAFVYHSTGISVLDAPYTSVAFTIPFANSGGSIAINSSGNRLLVTDFTDQIKVFPAPFSAATVPTAIVFPGSPHLSGVAINSDSSAALVSEFHTPRLFTMVQPFNPSPLILEDVLPPGLASSPTGFSDLSMSADGQFAIGTGNDTADTHQPAAFIEAPFDSPRIFAVDITGPGRGDGVARFLPPGLAPGLTITKSAPSTVPSLSNMTYTLTYANTGATVISDVQIKDTVPAGTTFVSAANGGNNNFGTVAWNVGNVAPNTSGTVSFTVNVTAAQGATITNSSYSAGGDPAAPVTGPPISTTVTAVVAGPDLSIQKTHTGNFTVGTNGQYTINVTNVGGASTSGVITITDILPTGLSFVSGTGNGTCSANGQTVTCTNAGPLAVNATATITLTVAVGAAAAPNVTNTATVSTPGDANSANDSSSDPTTVNKSAELALSFNVSSNSVQAGTNVTYTIGVTNNGPSPATGVTITSPLPANVTFVSGNFSQGTCSANTTLITCNLGNAAVGATATINGTIVVKPTSGPSFQAVVNLSGNEPDPNTGNNGASTTIGVTPPPPPIISSINPTTGAEAAGTAVTITGSNFAAFNAGTTSITFGGSLAGNVVVVNDTTITCLSPAGRGQVPVNVSNNNGSTNSSVIFTYQPPPLANANPAILTTIGAGNLGIVFPRPDLNLPTPTQNNVTGPANGVKPHGVAFFGSDSALVADLGNSRIFVVKVSTAAVQDTISTPGIYDGSGTLAVAPNLNFALASGIANSLAVVKAPFNSSSTITTVPLPGSILGFQSEAIAFDATGRAFVYTTAGISVLDAPYTSVAFTIPISNPNSGALAITPNGQTLLATTASNTVSIFSAPFSSSSVATALPVSGAAFLDGIAITPDGSTALVAESSTPKVFAVFAPFVGGAAVQSLPMPPGIGATGFEDVGISADGQFAIVTGGSNTGPALFIRGPFTSAGARTFAVAPNGGGRGGGAVRFLPPGLAPGLTISKTAPASIATNTNYSYTISFANTGQANFANVVVKDPLPAGTNFVSASNGGTLANGVVTWNIGALNAGASGTLTLTLNTSATSGNINNVNYTIEASGVTPVTGPPVSTPVLNNQAIVSSITPSTGAAAGGTAVLISGQNFLAQGAGSTTVKFGSSSATSVKVVDDHTISAVSPAGTGVVPVTVVNGNGTSNSDVTFTYTTSQLFLQVSEISPAQAPENGGTPVKITGIGFGSGNSATTAVLIGGKPATSVIVVSDVEIDAVVPAGTGIVNVSVSNNLGSSTLVGGFTYVKPLAQNILISWFAPNDPTKQLAPPRDTSTEFTTTPPSGGGDSISQTIQQIASQTPSATSADATTFVVAYNVFRGFTPDFDVNSVQQGGGTQALAPGVTQALSPGVTLIGTTPANVLSIVDSAAALAAAQMNGFGTPFYKVTAVYQTPTGQQSSQASNVAAPLPTITAVSVVNSNPGKIIRIDGVGFASFRAILEINGTQFTTLNFPPAQRLENGSTGRIELQDNTGNLIPVGAQVTITVLNPGLTVGSGSRSQAFIFRRLN